MAPQRYPTDLSDEAWRAVAPLIPPANPGGRPRSVDEREVVHAIRCLLRSGCAWRRLPREFPPWPSKEWAAMAETSEAMIRAAFGTTVLRRLAKRRAS